MLIVSNKVNITYIICFYRFSKGVLKYVICLDRFTVREFEYNEEALAAGKNEYTKLASDKQKQFVSDAGWLAYFIVCSFSNLVCLSTYMYVDNVSIGYKARDETFPVKSAFNTSARKGATGMHF